MQWLATKKKIWWQKTGEGEIVLILYYTIQNQGWECSSVTWCLSTMHEALGSNPSTALKRKEDSLQQSRKDLRVLFFQTRTLFSFSCLLNYVQQFIIPTTYKLLSPCCRTTANACGLALPLCLFGDRTAIMHMLNWSSATELRSQLPGVCFPLSKFMFQSEQLLFWTNPAY